MNALSARVAGQFAARGEGEVCAVFKRSFYLRFADNGYACVGDASIGRGPLNAIVDDYAAPALGERITLSAASTWQSGRTPARLDVAALREAARGRAPAQGLGCLVAGTHNALSAHAQPALDAIDEWIAGNALDARAEQLIGLGPGLTPSGDDYFGGVMVALHLLERSGQAGSLWRWLEPKLAARTSAISAAHLAAAATGAAHEALHRVLDGELDLDALDAVGRCSGWDALAGAVAVLQRERG
jgi:hypothetical protein